MRGRAATCQGKEGWLWSEVDRERPKACKSSAGAGLWSFPHTRTIVLRDVILQRSRGSSRALLPPLWLRDLLRPRVSNLDCRISNSCAALHVDPSQSVHMSSGKMHRSSRTTRRHPAGQMHSPKPYCHAFLRPKCLLDEMARQLSKLSTAVFFKRL